MNLGTVSGHILICLANSLLVIFYFLWLQGPLLLALVCATTIVALYDRQTRRIVEERVRRRGRGWQAHASYRPRWETGAAIDLWLPASLASVSPVSLTKGNGRGAHPRFANARGEIKWPKALSKWPKALGSGPRPSKKVAQGPSKVTQGPLKVAQGWWPKAPWAGPRGGYRYRNSGPGSLSTRPRNGRPSALRSTADGAMRTDETVSKRGQTQGNSAAETSPQPHRRGPGATLPVASSPVARGCHRLGNRSLATTSRRPLVALLPPAACGPVTVTGRRGCPVTATRRPPPPSVAGYPWPWPGRQRPVAVSATSRQRPCRRYRLPCPFSSLVPLPGTGYPQPPPVAGCPWPGTSCPRPVASPPATCSPAAGRPWLAPPAVSGLISHPQPVAGCPCRQPPPAAGCSWPRCHQRLAASPATSGLASVASHPGTCDCDPAAGRQWPRRHQRLAALSLSPVSCDRRHCWQPVAPSLLPAADGRQRKVRIPKNSLQVAFYESYRIKGVVGIGGPQCFRLK
jgi:hypothetical protein